jgi:hypothetical protein
METKKCITCHEEKPIVEFNFTNKAKNIRRADCKSCYSIIKKAYYQNNKVDIKNRGKEYRRIARTTLRRRIHDYKSSIGCKVCRETDPYCLDFHHLTDDKSFNISAFITRHRDWDRTMEEVGKCVILCSNCHRKLHAGHLVLLE